MLAGSVPVLPGSPAEAAAATPQLHGPARDLLTAATRVIVAELNSTVVLGPLAPATAAAAAGAGGAGGGSCSDTRSCKWLELKGVGTWVLPLCACSALSFVLSCSHRSPHFLTETSTNHLCCWTL